MRRFPLILEEQEITKTAQNVSNECLFEIYFECKQLILTLMQNRYYTLKVWKEKFS
ncbi:hypothetical protein J2736_000256 [Paenibacillus qinlingensis]|uniref:Uncharacterized protein n=1 Tax=Paenibacillus qinlingensis TaxID=1837343 RepID=A0ABU1NNU1_9BACL|nr:hypothetical protein [Paenibacillus qinlingensis]